MQDKIREDLFNLSDEKYRNFHSGLCPGIDNIIGIKKPILRKYAKELAKGDFRKYLKTANNKYDEEIMLQGMVICLAKMDLKERLEYIRRFVPKINNWAICDTFCAGLKIKEENLDEVWNFISAYLKSEKQYEIRFGIVMLLCYYVTPEYIDKVINELDKIQNKEYYVEMGVSWAVSICFVKFPKRTMKYLERNNLDDFTYNKAIQKIIESYRIDKETKDILRTMKRK